jgi:beta-lactamase superfamily II metal-dependent hydrolase
MMSYVVRTASGQVVVIDGGTEGDADHLAASIASLGNRVSAWFLTHPHSDHTDALTEILLRTGGLRIDALYASMPEPKWISRHATEDERVVYDRTVAVLAGCGRVPTELELGQTIEIGGVAIEVLGVKNPELTEDPINNQSVILKVSGAGRSVLFTGDLGPEASRKALAGPHADRLRADYVQMAHHGQNGAEEAFYQHVRPAYCLWPTPGWLWDNDDGGGRGSGPWRTLEVRDWMERLAIRRHYVMCEGPELIE